MLVKRVVVIKEYGVSYASFFVINIDIKYWACMN